MAERIGTADAPPPPPPPPPPDDGPRDRAPEATPELANALAEEDQDGSGGSGPQEQTQERNGERQPGPPDQPDAPDDGRPADTAESADPPADRDAGRDTGPDTENLAPDSPPVPGADSRPEPDADHGETADPAVRADDGIRQPEPPGAAGDTVQEEGEPAQQEVSHPQETGPDAAARHDQPAAGIDAGTTQAEAADQDEGFKAPADENLPGLREADALPSPPETAGDAGALRGAGDDPDVSPELTSALSGDDQGPSATETAQTGPEAAGTGSADQRQPAEPLTHSEYADLMRGGTDRADGGSGAGTDNPVTGRPDVAARYPADYVATPGPLPRVDQAHENPQNWVADINPDRNAPWRQNNCGECARAVDSAWNGQPAVAAALARPEELEKVSRMTDWAGEEPVPAKMGDVEQRLRELGPGSSAVVGCDWNRGGGHWFNALNDGGTIKAVDGQMGRVETWPPSRPGVGFDEGMMRSSDAIYFTPDGKVVKN